MMHMSQSLGVNCTYCHNTRSFASWDASTPQRATAWYGIRMVRDLNNDYLDPLAVDVAGRPAAARWATGRRSTARPATRASTSRCSARTC